jgi:hypothetical protein
MQFTPSFPEPISVGSWPLSVVPSNVTQTSSTFVTFELVIVIVSLKFELILPVIRNISQDTKGNNIPAISFPSEAVISSRITCRSNIDTQFPQDLYNLPKVETVKPEIESVPPPLYCIAQLYRLLRMHRLQRS